MSCSDSSGQTYAQSSCYHETGGSPPDASAVVWVPAYGHCSVGTSGGSLAAAPCARGAGSGTTGDMIYRAGCTCNTPNDQCNVQHCSARMFGQWKSSLPNTGVVSGEGSGNCEGPCVENPRDHGTACCCTVTAYESEASWTARDACCRNDASVIACSQDSTISSCPATGYGVVPPALSGDPSEPGSSGFGPPGRPQANLYCAPEHCWAVGDACDDSMARVAMQKEGDSSACLPVPVTATTNPSDGTCSPATLAPPSSCSNLTSTSQTGTTVRNWAQAAHAAGGTRAAWVDYAALQYCNAAHDETCACLSAAESDYVEPCLGNTYAGLLQKMEAAFGATAVQTSGIVSRKACWWPPCAPGAGNGAFLQTAAIQEQGATCPNTALCVTTIKNLNLDNPTDVVCISQNCSSHSCQESALMVRAMVDELGYLPATTGSACPQCNDAINAALVGTGFSVGRSSQQTELSTASVVAVALISVAVLALVIAAVVALRRRLRVNVRAGTAI